MIALAAAFLSAVLSSLGTFFVTTRNERYKEKRTQYSIAIVLQAELIRIHMRLVEHQNFLASYAGKFLHAINEAEALKFTEVSLGNDFIVYRSCIKDIGLLDIEAAYGVIYCYSNVQDFELRQETFLRELPSMANSSMLGHKAADLKAHEQAVIKHIERIVPMLASQSKALPFKVAP